MSDDDASSTLIRAQLVPAARDLEVKAGQRLMIVGGVCIGVYTGDKPPRAKLRPEGEELLAAAPRASNSSLPISRGGKDNPERAAMRTQLVQAMMRNGGKIYAFELTRELGPATDHRRGYYLRCAVADLEAEGRLRIGGKGGKGRLYELIPQPLAPVEPAA